MKYTVAFGNAFSGLTLEGVFDDLDSAFQYAEKYDNGEGSFVVQIHERCNNEG